METPSVTTVIGVSHGLVVALMPELAFDAVKPFYSARPQRKVESCADEMR
jgi:hypothetical protein